MYIVNILGEVTPTCFTPLEILYNMKMYAVLVPADYY